MRDRIDIEQESAIHPGQTYTSEGQIYKMSELQLEVLLDIRELLRNKHATNAAKAKVHRR